MVVKTQVWIYLCKHKCLYSPFHPWLKIVWPENFHAISSTDLRDLAHCTCCTLSHISTTKLSLKVFWQSCASGEFPRLLCFNKGTGTSHFKEKSCKKGMKKKTDWTKWGIDLCAFNYLLLNCLTQWEKFSFLRLKKFRFVRYRSRRCCHTESKMFRVSWWEIYADTLLLLITFLCEQIN